jgi:hypothetical protein
MIPGRLRANIVSARRSADPSTKKAPANAGAYKMAGQRRVVRSLLEDKMEEDEAALAQEYYIRFPACRP